jgi:putative ABC transport system permease protein
MDRTPHSPRIPGLRRVFRLGGARTVQAEVDEELQFHLDMRAEELARQGLSRNDAYARAVGEFGDLAAARTELTEIDRRRVERAGRAEWWGGLWQDVRYAARHLRNRPGFTAVVLVTLALGIGANTAIFTVVNSVLLRELPYAKPEELVRVAGSTAAEFVRLRDLSRAFQELAAYREESVSLSGQAEPERLDGALASANLFPTLGVIPALGRTFAPGEDEPGRGRVAVLSDGLWRRRFGADRGVIGRTVTLDGRPHRIIGVMPPGFHFPTRATQLWLPLVVDRSIVGAFWGSGGNKLVGRLAPGMTPAKARDDVRTAYRQIGRENPVWQPGPKYRADADVVPLQEATVGAVRPLLLILLGVVALVLLIACANVANLLLARATARRREFAVRTALGAGRGRLVRQMLTESVLLAALGGVAGLALAWLGVPALLSLMPSDMPRVAEIGIDGRVLAFTAVLSVATGVVFGLIPALRTTDTKLGSGLNDAGRGTSSGMEHKRLSQFVVATEIALAVILVTGAGLLVRSFWELRHVYPGFRAEQIVTARIAPPQERYAEPAQRRAFYDDVLRRVSTLSGVLSVGAVNRLPLSARVHGMAIRVQGQFEDLRRGLPMVDHYQAITPDYLRTMGVPVRRGRPFTEADRDGAPEVVLVSESMARQFWPGQDPIGKRIGYPWPSEWLTVVGVVGDVRQNDLRASAGTTVYRPFLQAPDASMTIVVRTTADAPSLAPVLRATVAEVDRDVPVSDVRTMATVLAASVARPRFAMLLLAAFAAVAMLLGVVGIYGVISYAVAQRTHELGVRITLGAQRGDIIRMILRDGSWLAAVGIALGLLAAFWLTRFLRSLLFGVTVADPVTYIGVALLLAAVALLATYIPARRATRVDPMVALRAGA